MFNLNIDNYSKEELFELFSLSLEKSNITELNYNHQLLVNKITKSNKKEKEIKDTIDFLNKAKNKLLLIISENRINSSKIPPRQNPLDLSISSKSRNLFIDKIITVDTRFLSSNYANEKTSFIYELSDPVKNVEIMDLISFEIPNIICVFSDKYKNNYYTINFGKEMSYTIELPNICLSEDELRSYEVLENLIQLLNHILKQSKHLILQSCFWELEDLGYKGRGLKKAIFNFDYEGYIKNEKFNVGDTVYVNKKEGKITEINVDNVFDAQILPKTYNVTYSDGSIDKNLKKSQLSYVKDNPEYVELDFVSLSKGRYEMESLDTKLGYLIGFRQPKIRVELDNNKIIKIASQSSIQLVGPKYIYLIVDDFNSNKFETIIPDKTTLEGCELDFSLGGNILAKILFDGGSLYYSVNRVSTLPRNYTGPVDLQKLKIALIDEYGRLVDLDNEDWSFSLRLKSNV